MTVLVMVSSKVVDAAHSLTDSGQVFTGPEQVFLESYRVFFLLKRLVGGEAHV